MTNSVSPSPFDVAGVVDSTDGAIDGFDYVDGQRGLIAHLRPLRVPAGAPLVVTGWAFDRRHGAAVREVRVVVDRVQQHVAEIGISRGDVAAGLAERTPETLGYRVIADAGRLPAGAHEVRTYALCADGAWYEAGARGFSVYEPVRPGLAPSGRTARLHVDQVLDVERDGTIVGFDGAVPLGRYALLSGWALDIAANTGPASVYGFDDRGNRWSAPCDISRPDIRAAMGAGDERLGFELLIPARALGRGRHVVRIDAVDGEGRPAGAPVAATVDVAAEPRRFAPYAQTRAGAAPAAATLTILPFGGEPATSIDLTGERVVEVRRGAPLVVAGWALAGEEAATDVFLELSVPEIPDAPHRYPAVAGFRRDRVPRGLPSPPVDDAWFTCRIGTETLAARMHRLDLIVVESGRRVLARRALGLVNVRAAGTTR